MSENENLDIQKEQGDISFSDFIDNIPNLRRGITVTGPIVRYDNEYVYVDVKDKSEGRVPIHEFADDPDFDLDKAIADHKEIEVYIKSIRNTDMGKDIDLSKARVDFSKNKTALEDAFKEKKPVKVKIIGVAKDGVVAVFGSVELYIHRTQLDYVPVDNLEEYKGKTLEVLITQYEPYRKRMKINASRRVLLTAERREKAQAIWENTKVGDICEGVVRNLTDFGAFVDLGGVDGLVHISELSWGRIKHAKEVVSVGDKIQVYVKEIDSEKKRISLGFKKIEEDPYYNLEERFPVGSIVHGKVVRMFAFGTFIAIAPGVDALCHISQTSTVRLNHPSDVLHEGMEVDARVLEVDTEQRRISVSIKDVSPIDPEGVEAPAEHRGDEVMTEYIDTEVVEPEVVEVETVAVEAVEPEAVEPEAVEPDSNEADAAE